MRFTKTGHSSLGASTKALRERGIEDGLEGQVGFGWAKQTGKGIPGGRGRVSKG